MLLILNMERVYNRPVLRILYSEGFEPRSDNRSCGVIVRVRVVMKRTIVGDNDY